MPGQASLTDIWNQLQYITVKTALYTKQSFFQLKAENSFPISKPNQFGAHNTSALHNTKKKSLL